MRKIEIRCHGELPPDTLAAVNSNSHRWPAEAEMDAARRQCEMSGVRWTARREQILRLLVQAETPVRPYDLIKVVQGEGPTNPPSVYRALDALVGAGLVHRIPSLNAFIACRHPGLAHTPSFLICESCQSVEEVPTLAEGLLQALSGDSLFKPHGLAIEAFGLCAACQ